MISSDPMRSNVQEKTRALVCLDRLQFLKGIEETTLHRGTMLDLQHQTIFRILGEKYPEKIHNLIDQYISIPESRKVLLNLAQSDLLEEIGSANHTIPDVMVNADKTKGGFSYISEIEKEFKTLVPLICEQDPKATIFSNPFGFSYFSGDLITEKNDHIKADGSFYSSVGGMMYYGFNISSVQSSFIQAHSINILAETFKAQIAHSDTLVSTYAAPQNEMIYALKDYAQTTPNWQKRIVDDTTRFLIAHEEGHNPQHKGNKPLFEIIDELNIDKSEFYAIEFPTEYDLKSWQRIKDGEGKPKDVLFLLGDFLSNMAVLETGIDEPTNKVLQAFNWWLAKPPTAKARPRGLVGFLANSYEYDRDLHIADMKRILQTSIENPKVLAKEMIDFEFRSWERLKMHSQTLQANPC
jgi:hypothetical protein